MPTQAREARRRGQHPGEGSRGPRHPLKRKDGHRPGVLPPCQRKSIHGTFPGENSSIKTSHSQEVGTHMSDAGGSGKATRI